MNMVSLRQKHSRTKALIKWRRGFNKTIGHPPVAEDVYVFKTGFNMGWNAHKKMKVKDDTKGRID